MTKSNPKGHRSASVSPIFTYLGHNTSRQPELHTAKTPLTSLILLVEPGREQMYCYFTIGKRSHPISDKVHSLKWLFAEKTVCRDVTSLPPALCRGSLISPWNNCTKLFDYIGQQIIKLDRISWIIKMEFQQCEPIRLSFNAWRLKHRTKPYKSLICGEKFAENQINVTCKFSYSRGWVRPERYTNIHVIEGRYQGDNLNTAE